MSWSNENKSCMKDKFSFQNLLASCLPWIPEQGTVGASGDLAPLAHLALGLMGEGRMWSRKSGWADAKMVGHCYADQLVHRLFSEQTCLTCVPIGPSSAWFEANSTGS